MIANLQQNPIAFKLIGNPDLGSLTRLVTPEIGRQRLPTEYRSIELAIPSGRGYDIPTHIYLPSNPATQHAISASLGAGNTVHSWEIFSHLAAQRGIPFMVHNPRGVGNDDESHSNEFKARTPQEYAADSKTVADFWNTNGTELYQRTFPKASNFKAAPPVLLGYSLGAFVSDTLMTMEESPRKAGVIRLCGCPIYSTIGGALRARSMSLSAFNEANSKREFDPLWKDIALLRGAMFASDRPERELQLFLKTYSNYPHGIYNQALYPRILFRQMLNFLKLRTEKTPTLVIGGKEDKVYRPWEIALDGRLLASPAKFISGAHHGIIYETQAKETVKLIESWLQQNGLMSR